MKPIRQFIRLLHIHYLLAKYGLDQVIVSIRLFAPFRFLIYLNPWNWFRPKNRTRGEALREVLEALGPIFIKFGQALSTRPDLLPDDIIKDLQQLQDNVKPFDKAIAMKTLKQAFGKSPYEVFANFDETVLASASIAQVHAATLKTGESVVVKILRPNIRKQIDRDLSLLNTMANLAHRYWPESRRLKPQEVVHEFEQNLIDELDLQREAANASQLRRQFERSDLLYVPQVHWDYVRENVFVMERIYGIPVTDIEAIQARGISLKQLAERGIQLFFTQVFQNCFFHADMHPGNIFVSPEHIAKPKFICVDFGIMGALSSQDNRYIAENLLAFFNRDYRRVATLHIESGWVRRDTRLDAFESAIRTVSEPIFERPLKDISFAMLVLKLFQVARRYNIIIQPQLILLQKTLLAIEGLGRQLYPDLDLWQTAKPFLERWIKSQIGPKAFFRHVKDNVPFLIEELPYMPKRMNDLMHIMKAHHVASLEQLQPSHAIPPQKARTQNIKSGLIGAGLTLLTLWAMTYFGLY